VSFLFPIRELINLGSISAKKGDFTTARRMPSIWS